jgi:hypothetical protein
MDLILKPSGGQNIVLRPQARAPWYEPAAVDAHEVELYKQEIDPATGTFLGKPVLVGRFAPAGKVAIPHDPDSDRDVIVYAMPYSASGAAGFSEVAHATQAYVPFRRETDAPMIGQNAPATTEEVEIGITGFTRFARGRRVTVSANADMSGPLAVLLFDSADYVARELPRYLRLQREAGVLTTEAGSELLTEDGSQLSAETGEAALPRTVYVTVAHNGGAAWTPESNILEVTFAAGDGTGGSAGDFDPTPRDSKNLDAL